MEYRLLGHLEVLARGGPVGLGGRQRRTVLAILLVHAGEAVSTDRLIDELWGESPPDASRKTVQAHVAHLRRVLTEAAPDNEVISAAPAGYVLTVDPETIDSRRCERLIEDARRLRPTDPTEAIETYGRALEMFRGEPLAGLADSAFTLRVEASRLEELRLVATEDRLDAMIAVGRVQEAIPEARRLLSQHPLRERMWAMLMLALYQSGRQSESLQAFSTARQTLAEELGLEPSAELRTLEQQILDQDPELDQAPAGADTGRRMAVRNPYKGLRTFDEADASDFFGRDAFVRSLLERLQIREAPGRLLMVTGPSGAGKSSAVRAGLIPAIRGGEIPGSDKWLIIDMFPGPQPFVALAKTLLEEDSLDSLLELAAEIRGSNGAFHLRRRLPPATLLLVDQLEELFALTDRDQRDDFLALLADVVLDETSGVRVVSTIRGDRLEGLMADPRIGPLLERSLILIPPLADHEVRAVIIEPAARVGIEVDPDLVSELVHDVASRSTTLPLLQFALADLFERRRDATMTMEAYRTAGGISGGLSRRADEIVDRLDPGEQETARQLCLRLVTITEDAHPVRRRVARVELDQLPVDRETLGRVLDDLGRHRLLTFDQDPETGESMVEIAHEAVLDEWDRLRSWIDEARHDLRRYDRLAAAAREWQRSDEDPSYLLSGSRLAVTEEWADGTSLALTSEEQRFLAEGQRQATTAERQRTRRRRLTVAALSWGLVLLGVLTAIAFIQRGIAQTEARQETIRQLAAVSALALDEDPQRAILLALEAAEVSRRAGEPVRPEAVAALHRAVQTSRLEMRLDRGIGAAFNNDGTLVFLELTPPGPEVAYAAFSPDWRFYAEHLWWVEEDESDLIIVWDPATGDEVTRLSPTNDGSPEDQILIFNMTWSPDGELIAAATWTTRTAGYTVWEVASGEEVLYVPGAAMARPVFLDDQTLTVPEPESERVVFYDIAGGGERDHLDTPGFAPTHLAFDPVRRWLVLGSTTSTPNVQVWDLESRSQEWSNDTPGFFHPTLHAGSGMLALVGGEGGIRLLNLADRSNLWVLRGHTTEAWNVSFSPDGRQLVSRARGEVLVWDIASAGPRGVGAILAGTSPALGVTVAPDMREVAVHSLGSVQRFDLATLESVGDVLASDMIDRLTPAPISPDWRLVAFLDDDGKGWVHHLVTGEVILELPPCTNPVGFSSDGSALVLDGVRVCSEDDAPPETELRSRVIAVPSGEQLLDLGQEQVGHPLGAHQGAVFNPAGRFPADRFLAVNRGNWVEVYDMSAGLRLTTLHTRQEWDDRPLSLGFDPSGRYLAVGGFESRGWVLDMEQVADGVPAVDALIFDRAVDPGGLPGVAISKDGVLATSGFRSLRLWDLNSGEHLIQIPTDTTLSSFAVFTPDYLIYLDQNPSGNVLRRFPLDPDGLIALAESRVTRGFTTEECDLYQLDC